MSRTSGCFIAKIRSHSVARVFNTPNREIGLEKDTVEYRVPGRESHEGMIFTTFSRVAPTTVHGCTDHGTTLRDQEVSEYCTWTSPTGNPTKVNPPLPPSASRHNRSVARNRGKPDGQTIGGTVAHHCRNWATSVPERKRERAH